MNTETKQAQDSIPELDEVLFPVVKYDWWDRAAYFRDRRKRYRLRAILRYPSVRKTFEETGQWRCDCGKLITALSKFVIVFVPEFTVEENGRLVTHRTYRRARDGRRKLTKAAIKYLTRDKIRYDIEVECVSCRACYNARTRKGGSVAQEPKIARLNWEE